MTWDCYNKHFLVKRLRVIAAEEPLAVNYAREEDAWMLYPRTPLLSSYAADWDRLYLQYHQQPPQKMPEHYSKQHRIIINDHTLPTPKIERIEELSQSSQVLCGTITVVPADAQNSACWDTEHRFIALIFESNLLTQHIAESHVDDIELLPTLSHPDPLIHSIGSALKAELESNGLGGRLYVDSLVAALMAHLLRHYSAQKCTFPTFSSGLPKSKLKQVIEHIYHHLGQDLTVAQLALIAQMSPNYFSGLFKQSTGLTPHQYVLRCRIDRAKQLLLQGELSIAEVSYCLGFTHQSHFSHHFKRLVGSSPKAFLKSQ